MEAVKELSDVGSFLVMGAEFVESDWHKGEIIVERYGLLHPKYRFIHKDKEIAALDWRRKRLGCYEAKDIRLVLQVGQMGRSISAKDDASQLSYLAIKRSLDPRRAKMLINLTNNDTFIVSQKQLSPTEFSLEVSKKHYVTTIIEFRFALELHRTRVATKIEVSSIMRWEAKHFHHLVALVMARIVFLQEQLRHNSEIRKTLLHPVVKR